MLIRPKTRQILATFHKSYETDEVGNRTHLMRAGSCGVSIYYSARQGASLGTTMPGGIRPSSRQKNDRRDPRRSRGLLRLGQVASIVRGSLPRLGLRQF
jgi:hypothetical protein